MSSRFLRNWIICCNFSGVSFRSLDRSWRLCHSPSLSSSTTSSIADMSRLALFVGYLGS